MNAATHLMLEILSQYQREFNAWIQDSMDASREDEMALVESVDEYLSMIHKVTKTPMSKIMDWWTGDRRLLVLDDDGQAATLLI